MVGGTHFSWWQVHTSNGERYTLLMVGGTHFSWWEVHTSHGGRYTLVVGGIVLVAHLVHMSGRWGACLLPLKKKQNKEPSQCNSERRVKELPHK
jgi:hypothetical protein